MIEEFALARERAFRGIMRVRGKGSSVRLDELSFKNGQETDLSG